MSERDQRLDAAWRAASRDEPPPALDAAIRAAARRAIDVPPRRGRNKHWWYPLAAAATVALLAVGIAQLTPSERVAPQVSDIPAAPGEPRLDAALQAPATKAPMAAAPASVLPPPIPAATPAAAMAAGAGAAERAPVPAARSPQKPIAEAKPQSLAQNKLERTASEMAAAGSVSPPPAQQAPSTRPLSEPFPATGKAGEGRDANLEQGQPAISTSARQAAEPVRAQKRVAAADVAGADSAKLAPAPARTIDDWIKRIRDLKAAGRLDEAAKEMAAFRSAYGERADALLPEDLRQIRP